MTEDAHAELLQAIGRALGEPGPYIEIVGERLPEISLGTLSSPPVTLTREVLGGAKSASGRVAWIELRSDKPEGEYVPVEIDLRVAWEGELRSITDVYTYNPYFGCSVFLARWYGDEFVFVYREKHKMIVSRLAPPYEIPDNVVLSDDLIEDRDILYFVRDDAVWGLMIPSLQPVAPVKFEPTGRWPVHELWLEAPGVARLATVLDTEGASWDERLASARAGAVTLLLSREPQ